MDKSTSILTGIVIVAICYLCYLGVISHEYNKHNIDGNGWAIIPEAVMINRSDDIDVTLRRMEEAKQALIKQTK